MRSFVTAAAAATLVIAFAPAAHALPPCNQVCQYACGPGATVVSCAAETCRYTVTCSDGRSGTYPCSCGGSACFLAGTKITMADGSERPIESIKAGDMVLAYDEATGELKPDRVKLVHDPVEAEGYLVVNGTIQLTNTHPVLTPGGWKEIGTLAVGDTLIGADKKEITVASIDLVAKKVTVYNFATNPYKTYVASGVIVHNKNPIPEQTNP